MFTRITDASGSSGGSSYLYFRKPSAILEGVQVGCLAMPHGQGTVRSRSSPIIARSPTPPRPDP